ncbi:MAG: nicotinate (nicotinamide) nucleotide adenylyltransferase [Acidobacteriota bacterium]
MDRHGTPRVAFFGGSFDPPHLGHLGVAKAARDALRLDTVLFAPVGLQPLKSGGSSASFMDRVEMVRLAIADEPGFAISMSDAPHADGRPNYTVDTLRRLRGELPATGDLFCLLGADSLATFRSWHCAEEIPFVARLVVASRPGEAIDDLARFMPPELAVSSCDADAALSNGTAALRTWVVRNVAGASAALYVLSGLDFPMSATGVRAALRGGARPEMVPGSVLEYIRRHGLYR